MKGALIKTGSPSLRHYCEFPFFTRIECHNDYLSFFNRKQRSCAAYEEKKEFYGDNSLIQFCLLQVSTLVTFFSEVSNLQHQKKVRGNLQKS